MKKLIHAVAGIGLVVMMGSCNATSFRGGSGKQDSNPPQNAKNRPKADKFFKLACENGSGSANLVTKLQGASSLTVSLEGEFCGLPTKVPSGEVTVLFIVDMSGSMALSDPPANGSCGRYQAIQALLGKLNESSQNGISIKVGLEVFGNDAQIDTSVTSLSQFQSRVSPSTICRQDAGGTNYEAAFVVAQSELQAKSGQKVVYFISDGLPSVSNQTRSNPPLGSSQQELAQVYSAGVAAAESLRQGSNVILDVVYLDSPAARTQSQQMNGGPLLEEPVAYLEKIAGSKDRVRFVTSAAELAGQITTFDNPGEVTLNASSVRGEISAGVLGTQTVKLKSLEKDPTRPGIWLFVTEAFKLYGKSGSYVENKVTLTINGADGKPYKATAIINFASED